MINRDVRAVISACLLMLAGATVATGQNNSPGPSPAANKDFLPPYTPKKPAEEKSDPSPGIKQPLVGNPAAAIGDLKVNIKGAPSPLRAALILQPANNPAARPTVLQLAGQGSSIKGLASGSYTMRLLSPEFPTQTTTTKKDQGITITTGKSVAVDFDLREFVQLNQGKITFPGDTTVVLEHRSIWNEAEQQWRESGALKPWTTLYKPDTPAATKSEKITLSLPAGNYQVSATNPAGRTVSKPLGAPNGGKFPDTEFTKEDFLRAANLIVNLPANAGEFLIAGTDGRPQRFAIGGKGLLLDSGRYTLFWRAAGDTRPPIPVRYVTIGGGNDVIITAQDLNPEWLGKAELIIEADFPFQIAIKDSAGRTVPPSLVEELSHVAGEGARRFRIPGGIPNGRLIVRHDGETSEQPLTVGYALSPESTGARQSTRVAIEEKLFTHGELVYTVTNLVESQGEVSLVFRPGPNRNPVLEVKMDPAAGRVELPKGSYTVEARAIIQNERRSITLPSPDRPLNVPAQLKGPTQQNFDLLRLYQGRLNVSGDASLGSDRLEWDAPVQVKAIYSGLNTAPVQGSQKNYAVPEGRWKVTGRLGNKRISKEADVTFNEPAQIGFSRDDFYRGTLVVISSAKDLTLRNAQGAQKDLVWESAPIIIRDDLTAYSKGVSRDLDEGNWVLEKPGHHADTFFVEGGREQSWIYIPDDTEKGRKQKEAVAFQKRAELPSTAERPREPKADPVTKPVEPIVPTQPTTKPAFVLGSGTENTDKPRLAEVGRDFDLPCEDLSKLRMVWSDGLRGWMSATTVSRGQFGRNGGGNENLPATPRYENALAFIEALNQPSNLPKESGYGYSLPTLEQWQKVVAEVGAKPQDRNHFLAKDQKPAPREIDSGPQTAGFHHLYGNVWQLVRSDRGQPLFKAVGGSFASDPKELGKANYITNLKDGEARANVGFRVVLVKGGR